MTRVVVLLAVSLGCIYDNKRSEPGSWAVVGMIPVFDKQKAIRAGRKETGPDSCARRKAELLHQSYNAVLQGWDSLTSTVKRLMWADGQWRFTRFFFRALLSDQPETDTFCCDTSQSCKICVCPKDRMHLPLAGGWLSTEYPRKLGASVQAAAYKAADGQFSNGTALFDRTGPKWRPNKICNQTTYERIRREHLNGTHIMPNAFWNRAGFDVQQMVCYLF